MVAEEQCHGFGCDGDLLGLRQRVVGIQRPDQFAQTVATHVYDVEDVLHEELDTAAKFSVSRETRHLAESRLRVAKRPGEWTSTAEAASDGPTYARTASLSSSGPGGIS
ncbi:hypothetical protein MTOK_35420 [Mycolicibacterium tokaiense]|nr:hypothetical protein MTOK_35420 [Mycolicibacterium tokaiense]